MEGLRGLGMTLVFFGHFEGMFRHLLAPESTSLFILNFLQIVAHRGIAFFLVITGYFVYGRFIDQPEPYGPFVRRRLARIYPLYLAVLALYLCLSMVFPSESKIPHNPAAALLYILENALLLPGLLGTRPIIVVTWAISYLLLFYITAPLLVNGLRMYRWKGWQRTLFLLLLGSLWLGSRLVYPKVNLRPVMLVLGMLIYEAQRCRWFRSRMSRLGEAASIILLLICFELLYLLNYGHLQFLPKIELLGGTMGVYWCIILGLGLFYFCLYCFSYNGRLSAWLQWTPLRGLGNMSYSYYLFHGLTLKAIALVAVLLLPPMLHSSALFWGILPIAFLATLTTSSLLFLFVERRLKSSRAVLRYTAK